MDVAVISPHRDDAAFSCGLLIVALLRAGKNVTVCNLFTRSDYAVTNIGINPEAERVEGVSLARLREDKAAVAAMLQCATRLSCTPGRLTLRDYGWLDAPLRLQVNSEYVVLAPVPVEEAHAQAHFFAKHLNEWAHFDAVMAPLALGDHIDHRIARETAKLVVPAERLAFYQDLPYAARLSADARSRETTTAFSGPNSQSWLPSLMAVEDGLAMKQLFALCYPSQIEPQVATEIAAYGADLCGSAGQAAELWFAQLPLQARLQAACRQA